MDALRGAASKRRPGRASCKVRPRCSIQIGSVRALRGEPKARIGTQGMDRGCTGPRGHGSGNGPMAQSANWRRIRTGRTTSSRSSQPTFRSTSEHRQPWFHCGSRSHLWGLRSWQRQRRQWMAGIGTARGSRRCKDRRILMAPLAPACRFVTLN